VLKPVDWGARVDGGGNKVREALEKKNPQWAKDYSGRINDVAPARGAADRHRWQECW
jgi:hypothetical protein